MLKRKIKFCPLLSLFLSVNQVDCFYRKDKTVPNNSDAKTVFPPYVSFKTFRSGVQSIREHGLPDVIDRSIWSAKSGADQTALLGAFKFLGLTDQAGETQQFLKDLVGTAENTDAEKHLLGSLMRQRYDKLFELDLEAATPNQVAEAIGSYGPQGSTLARAVRFFIKVAGHCGIPMSGRISKSGTTASPANGTATRTRRRARRRPQRTPAAELTTETGQGGTAFREVDLPNAGGRLTLSGTFNLFELTGVERALVFEVIDKMMELEEKTRGETPEDDTSEETP